MTRQTGTRTQQITARSSEEASDRQISNQHLVPSRRQYLALKEAYPEAILLYRMGDFYETFDDDARIVARDARITLTSRNFGRSGRAPMAGIPYHALNHYLGRLLTAGHTIAIAEQISEAGRGLVDRAVTRVLTPGTVAEQALLSPSENRYLAAICPLESRMGLAWVDVSTGEFCTIEFDRDHEHNHERLCGELARLNAAECLIPDTFTCELPATVHPTRFEHWHFAPDRARELLCERFNVASLTPYGCADLPAAIGAAGAIVAYVQHTNAALLPLLIGLRTESSDGYVGLDTATRRNLELTRSFGTSGTRGSLLGVLDLTQTAMGARALRRMVSQPLRDLGEINQRQAIVAGFVADSLTRTKTIAMLGKIGDVERLTSRITQGLGSIRDFLTLHAILVLLPEIVEIICASDIPVLRALAEHIDECADVREQLNNALEEDDNGPRIRSGFSPELDAANEDIREIRAWLLGLEQQERERTGIRSLKVRFNKVFGYYIEITRANVAAVPETYQRKQTIANGERYITTELKEAEARILVADEQIAALERRALVRIGDVVTAVAGRLLATAAQLARLDALLSLAEIAVRAHWIAPIVDDSDGLEIVGGRHPVVESRLAGEAFIPNNCQLGGAAPKILLVTGPNMGGKSTYLRQTAIIALLAQIGSFVPATTAHIGLVDRIFTRVGAQDDLAGGASTFMVEMVETAAILHQATRRSLVILDEVGRGTSTEDGLAIARAVLEDIHDRIGSRTLFATHYLQLTSLAEALPGVVNAHVAALETDERVIFLYALRPGPADRAYGVQVARLAGLPPWVADRAASVLVAASSTDDQGVSRKSESASAMINGLRVAEGPNPAYQLALDGFPLRAAAAEHLVRALRDLDLSNMSPREAMDWLFEQQARL